MGDEGRVGGPTLEERKRIYDEHSRRMHTCSGAPETRVSDELNVTEQILRGRSDLSERSSEVLLMGVQGRVMALGGKRWERSSASEYER